MQYARVTHGPFVLQVTKLQKEVLMNNLEVSAEVRVLASEIVRQMFDEMDKHHGMRHEPEWRIYSDAKNRCNCATDKDFKHYGGRGIRFLFPSFKSFFNEIGPRPTPQHVLDRTNNDGNYEAGNVRWVTHTESVRNRRKPARKTKQV